MCLFLSEGTEEIRIIPGNQTTLDLKDLTVGISYGVSVTALVGENEGDPVTVYIKPGELVSFNLPASSSTTKQNRAEQTLYTLVLEALKLTCISQFMSKYSGVF